MHMLPSTSFKYIVQGCCSLMQYPEFHKLHLENAKALGDWIFEDIICCWGSLWEIVTDNSLNHYLLWNWYCIVPSHPKDINGWTEAWDTYWA
jgi:hypothetical protein